MGACIQFLQQGTLLTLEIVSDVHEYHYQTFCAKRDGIYSNQLAPYKTNGVCAVCKPSGRVLVRISALSIDA